MVNYLIDLSMTSQAHFTSSFIWACLWLWKAVFIELQRSIFTTVIFFSFEIDLYFGTSQLKMTRIIPKKILHAQNQNFIQYSVCNSTFCGIWLMYFFLIFQDVPSSILTNSAFSNVSEKVTPMYTNLSKSNLQKWSLSTPKHSLDQTQSRPNLV